MAIDPFAEPGDTEGTVFRPRPSGTSGTSGPVPQTRAAPAAPQLRETPKIGDNPLLAAAAPVLAAAIRVSGERSQPPDPERLRTAMTKAIRQFESDALATGARHEVAPRRPLRHLRHDRRHGAQHPWGMQSSWVQHSLTSVFHGEVIGGERFFDILEKMQADMGHNAPVVELMYLCTSLGFEGRYRVMPRGVAALAELRDGVYRLIRNLKGDFERELSPHCAASPPAPAAWPTAFPSGRAPSPPSSPRSASMSCSASSSPACPTRRSPSCPACRPPSPCRSPGCSRADHLRPRPLPRRQPPPKPRSAPSCISSWHPRSKPA